MTMDKGPGRHGEANSHIRSFVNAPKTATI